ncbi:MAG: hypothetical protein M3Q65_18700 [Chloroflexota bacterium]|nr:hypothetical protein [Chloroflexota bacterium]
MRVFLGDGQVLHASGDDRDPPRLQRDVAIPQPDRQAVAPPDPDYAMSGMP